MSGDRIYETLRKCMPFYSLIWGLYTYSNRFFEVKKNQRDVVYLHSVGHWSAQIVFSRAPGDSGTFPSSVRRGPELLVQADQG